MIRLFTALEIPSEIGRRLHALQSGLDGAHWVEPTDFHITLRFMGDIAENLASDLDERLAQISVTPFEIEIEGVGVFGGVKPHSVYAAVKPSEALHLLHQRHENAARRARLAPEKRNYTPHVTLARFGRIEPGSVYRFIEAHNLFATPRWTATGCVLFSSRTSKGGGPYVAERFYPDNGTD